MGYTREKVPLGKTVSLRAIFVDDTGEPIALDSVTVEVRDPDGTLITTHNSATTITDGYYEVEETIGASASKGTWKDTWTGVVGSATLTETFSFTVVETGKVKTQTIDKNKLIVVLLDPTIADSDGRTLNEEVQIAFSTRYDPYYASPDLVRTEVGTWLDSIPNDTLSLMIHWASKEADLITPKGPRGSNYNTARTKFVIFDVALRCLTLPVAGAGSGTKQLGDLMIRKNLSFKDAIEDMKKKREEWFRVVNSNGRINPGQGFGPSVAMKGQYHPENKRMGRLWWHPLDYPYPIPAGNNKIRKSGQRKFRKGYAEIVDGRIYPPDEEPD